MRWSCCFKIWVVIKLSDNQKFKLTSSSNSVIGRLVDNKKIIKVSDKNFLNKDKKIVVQHFYFLNQYFVIYQCK